MHKTNNTAKILFVFGWIIVAAGVLGFFILGSLKDVYGEPHPFRFVYGLVSILSSLIIGLLFAGISEIIEQQDMANQLMMQKEDEVENKGRG